MGLARELARSTGAKMERFENYFQVKNYCDWVALSAYGPVTPTTRDGTESLRFKLRKAYPRLTKSRLASRSLSRKFGCDLHNSRVNVRAGQGRRWKICFQIAGGDYPVLAGGMKDGRTTVTKNTYTDMIIFARRGSYPRFSRGNFPARRQSSGGADYLTR